MFDYLIWLWLHYEWYTIDNICYVLPACSELYSNLPVILSGSFCFNEEKMFVIVFVGFVLMIQSFQCEIRGLFLMRCSQLFCPLESIVNLS
uniref:Uncharacterized protein n=1 Tax=Arundo donax TaxID=35708 RepID=A0A0A8YA62_ARUDO